MAAEEFEVVAIAAVGGAPRAPSPAQCSLIQDHCRWGIRVAC